MPLSNKEEFELLQLERDRAISQSAIQPELRDAVATALPLGEATAIRGRYPSEKIFGPITEGIAQVGASLARGPLPFKVGAVVAGGVGATLEAGRQITQQIGDEPGAPATSTEAALRIGKAGLFSAGVEGAGRGLFGAIGGIFGKATLTPAQEQVKTIAIKYDVPLSVADIKQTKLSSLLESISEKSLLAGDIIARFRKGQAGAFNKVTDDLVAKSGGKIDRETAGDMVVDVFNTAAQAAKDKTNLLYAAARATIIDPAKKNLNNTAIKQTAREMLAKEELVASNIQSPIVPLLKDIANKKSIYDNIDSADVLQSKLKEFIREEAIKAGKITKGQRTTPLAAKYTQLLSSLEKDYDEYYSMVNPGAKGLYDIAKAAAKNEKLTFANKDVIRIINSNPEKIVDAVIKPNNVTTINRIKAAVGEDGFKPVKQRFLQDIVESTRTGEAGAVPTFRPSAMLKVFDKYEPETLRAIFNKKELIELGEISKLASSLQTAERLAGNPSGTAQIQTGSAFFLAIFADPLVAGAGIGIPVILAKTMTSSVGRKLMIDGLKAPAGSAELAKAVTRFTNFAILNKLTVPVKSDDKK